MHAPRPGEQREEEEEEVEEISHCDGGSENAQQADKVGQGRKQEVSLSEDILDLVKQRSSKAADLIREDPQKSLDYLKGDVESSERLKHELSFNWNSPTRSWFPMRRKQRGDDDAYMAGINRFLAGLCDENGLGGMKDDILKVILKNHCDYRPQNWRVGSTHNSCIKLDLPYTIDTEEFAAFCWVRGFINAEDCFESQKRETSKFSGTLNVRMLRLNLGMLEQLDKMKDSGYRELLDNNPEADLESMRQVLFGQCGRRLKQ